MIVELLFAGAAVGALIRALIKDLTYGNAAEAEQKRLDVVERTFEIARRHGLDDAEVRSAFREELLRRRPAPDPKRLPRGSD
ncbi:MAG TPA: hypothetical protein VF715_03625 [Thermoleophilaceae bacterium]